VKYVTTFKMFRCSRAVRVRETNGTLWTGLHVDRALWAILTLVP